MKPCNQCGKCCLAYGGGGLSATEDEIRWWETARPHIARYVGHGEIWVDPDTGKRLQRCPWLVPLDGEGAPGYGCQIYADRPDDCRHYPVLIDDMVRDECEMLEIRDLRRPDRAQAELDRLMADSRPPGGSS